MPVLGTVWSPFLSPLLNAQSTVAHFKQGLGYEVSLHFRERACSGLGCPRHADCMLWHSKPYPTLDHTGRYPMAQSSKQAVFILRQTQDEWLICTEDRREP